MRIGPYTFELASRWRWRWLFYDAFCMPNWTFAWLWFTITFEPTEEES